MRLAVLADAIGERFDPPVFGLGDRAAHLLEDGLVLVGQFIDLLCAEILTRKVDVFVERHEGSFLVQRVPPSGAKPARASGRLERPRCGNTGRRAIGPAAVWRGRPFSSRPGSSGKPALYRLRR